MSNQENSKIRIKALLKELDRQQLEVRKKKNLIRVIIAVVILFFVIILFFSYKKPIENKQYITPVEQVDIDLEEKRVPLKLIKSYQLVFDSLHQYPLARFFNKDKALSFQKEIESLHLPKIFISIDSIDGKERVLTISSNYRYYIQVGIFKKQLFSNLPDNMVYLHQIKDKNFYKYRLGPFSNYIQAVQLVKYLSLKDYLIVEVSN